MGPPCTVLHVPHCVLKARLPEVVQPCPSPLRCSPACGGGAHSRGRDPGAHSPALWAQATLSPLLAACSLCSRHSGRMGIFIPLRDEAAEARADLRHASASRGAGDGARFPDVQPRPFPRCRSVAALSGLEAWLLLIFLQGEPCTSSPLATKLDLKQNGRPNPCVRPDGRSVQSQLWPPCPQKSRGPGAGTAGRCPGGLDRDTGGTQTGPSSCGRAAVLPRSWDGVASPPTAPCSRPPRSHEWGTTEPRQPCRLCPASVLLPPSLPSLLSSGSHPGHTGHAFSTVCLQPPRLPVTLTIHCPRDLTDNQLTTLPLAGLGGLVHLKLKGNWALSQAFPKDSFPRLR